MVPTGFGETTVILAAILTLIWTPIMVLCFGAKKKNEAGPPESCSETSKNSSLQNPLQQPTALPLPSPQLKLDEIPNDKIVTPVLNTKVSGNQKKSPQGPAKSPKKADRKSMEKVTPPKKTKEKEKLSQKGKTKTNLNSTKKKKAEEAKEKTKTEESDHIIIIKKADEDDENPKTDLESHQDDLSDLEKEKKRKQREQKLAKSKAGSNEKPEASGYAY